MDTISNIHAQSVSNPTGDVWSHPASASQTLLIKDGRSGTIAPSGRMKVALIGFAASTKDLAPYDNPEYEIWGLNQLYRHIPRADRWFDIHANYHEHVVEGTDHVGWIRKAKIPIYMNQYHEEYPTCVRYPIEMTMAYFGRCFYEPNTMLDYYTSTVAYMLALAIVEGFRTIAVYGIDLIAKQEYVDQKPCAEFYLGWAAASGIILELPPQSALLTQEYRYGYQVSPVSVVPREDFIARRNRIEAKKTELQVKLALLDGASQEDEYWAQVFQLRQRGATIEVDKE